MDPYDVGLIVFGCIALVGVFIVLLDRRLKGKG
jgi:hypothetical protein